MHIAFTWDSAACLAVRNPAGPKGISNLRSDTCKYMYVCMYVIMCMYNAHEQVCAYTTCVCVCVRVCVRVCTPQMQGIEYKYTTSR